MNQNDQAHETRGRSKSVGAALGIGILLLPFIFAWFTLRRGYSTTARILSLGWMAVVVLISLGAAGAGSNDQAAEQSNEIFEADTDSNEAVPPQPPLTAQQSSETNAVQIPQINSYINCGYAYLTLSITYDDGNIAKSLAQNAKDRWWKAAQQISEQNGISVDQFKKQLEIIGDEWVEKDAQFSGKSYSFLQETIKREYTDNCESMLRESGNSNDKSLWIAMGMDNDQK